MIHFTEDEKLIIITRRTHARNKNMNMWYVLEIIRYKRYPSDIVDGIFEHVGYVTEPSDRDPRGSKRVRKFRTKEAAGEAYDQVFGGHGMRPLHSFGKWCSDWCPKTMLAYVVRKHYGIGLNEHQSRFLDHWGRPIDGSCGDTKVTEE